MNLVLFIGGPTACGKNALAMELATQLPSEIINADSRQVYRELIIGTNLPSEQDFREVHHHLYAFLPPTAGFSAAEYEQRAVPLVTEITAKGRLPIVVGGTGFYMKALLKGSWPVPPADPGLRSRLRALSERRGPEFLHRMLRRIDPVTAVQVAPRDTYRIYRGLEIYFQTGRKRSELASLLPDRFPSVRVFLEPDRSRLQDVIRERTRAMFAAGWVEEVQRLLEEYAGFERMPAAASLGYREIVRHLRGEMKREECMELVILRTLQYAKRQMTWFRNQDRFHRLSGEPGLMKNKQSVLQWIEAARLPGRDA